MDVRRRMSRRLPPFASDYSGVASALYDLGGIVVFCDGGCCTDHYIFYDEPRWDEHQTDVFSTTLRTMDAVFGCDEDVIEGVCSLVSSMPTPPSFVAFVSTPVPALVGTDAKGVAKDIGFRLGIPALGFSTTGFGYYDNGIEAACKALVGEFAGPVRQHDAKDASGNIVNVIGATPLDFGPDFDRQALEDTLLDEGVAVNAWLPFAGGIDEIERLQDAGLNIAVTASGLRVAKWLEKRFGMPYEARCPIPPDLEPVQIAAESERVLIVGDQVVANGIAHAIRDANPKSEAIVASPFMWDEELAGPLDFRFEGEFDLAEKAAIVKPDAIVADPLYRFLTEGSAADEAAPRFVSFVHPAVSSRLFWRQPSE